MYSAESKGCSSKPHVVITPFPIQSHLNTLLNLAKLLHSRGFHITYVNTEYNHKRLLKSRGRQALDGLPDFRFETIPDGLLPCSSDATTQDLTSLVESTSKNCLVPFMNLLKRLQQDSASSNGSLVPPVTCLVSDAVMTFTVKAAHEFGLPVAIYCPISAISYLAASYCDTLFDKGILPLKDESYLTNGYLDTKVDWLPGMKNMRLRDLPSHLTSLDPNDYLMLSYTNSELKAVKSADAMIFNTLSELESEALDTLSSVFPPLYTIGPLPLLLANEIPQNQPLDSIASNMWKGETRCIEWLESSSSSKKPNSVIYVNFGSVAVMSAEQVCELGWGLADSKKAFLWVIRPDLVEGGSAILSPEFIDEIKDRGVIASWCDQEKVLNHPSVGGFLTHCGWNSIMESICAGVPLGCWPFHGDQLTNCSHVCTQWGIGIEIQNNNNYNNVKRQQVERLVNELMEGEKGKMMRQKALEWQMISKQATQPGGSSCISFDKLVNQVLMKRKT